MVDRGYILRSALNAYRRWGSVMSRAMLCALGCPIGVVSADPDDGEARVSPELAWCFANHGSPMDGRC